MIGIAPRRKFARLTSRADVAMAAAAADQPPAACVAEDARRAGARRACFGRLSELLATGFTGQAVLLFRHGAKEQVQPGTLSPSSSEKDYWAAVRAVPLTAEGEREAEELGRQLQAQVLSASGAALECSSLRSSEVYRCVQTTRAIARGAGLPLLGDAVIHQPALMNGTHRAGEEAQAAQAVRCRGFPAIIDELRSGARVQGFHSLREMAEGVGEACGLEARPGAQGPKPELTLACTHDSIMYCLACHFSQAAGAAPPPWPAFLESALWWREEGQSHFLYDGTVWTAGSGNAA